MHEWWRNINWVVIKRISPLVWGFGLVIIALLLIKIPFRYVQLAAIAPGLVGALLIYQALFHNKY